MFLSAYISNCLWFLAGCVLGMKLFVWLLRLELGVCYVCAYGLMNVIEPALINSLSLL